jgi:hypothetical protein
MRVGLNNINKIKRHSLNARNFHLNVSINNKLTEAVGYHHLVIMGKDKKGNYICASVTHKVAKNSYLDLRSKVAGNKDSTMYLSNNYSVANATFILSKDDVKCFIDRRDVFLELPKEDRSNLIRMHKINKVVPCIKFDKDRNVLINYEVKAKNLFLDDIDKQTTYFSTEFDELIFNFSNNSLENP